MVWKASRASARRDQSLTAIYLFQGHALWHILGAMASWKLYHFYNSPKLEPAD